MIGKFLFNLQTTTLKIPHGDYFLVLEEERKFSSLGRIGFYLDDNPQHLVLFTIKKEKVLCVYKLPNGAIYQKEVDRPASGIVEVEFKC